MRPWAVTLVLAALFAAPGAATAALSEYERVPTKIRQAAERFAAQRLGQVEFHKNYRLNAQLSEDCTARLDGCTVVFDFLGKAEDRPPFYVVRYSRETGQVEERRGPVL